MQNKTFLLALFLFGLISGLLVQGQTLPTVPKDSCRISFPSDSRIEWFCYQIKAGETLEGLFGSFWEPVLRFNRIDRLNSQAGACLKIPANLKEVIDFTPLPRQLEQAKTYRRFILLDRSEQFLGAYEFGELKFSFPITSGRGTSTPRGTFRVLGRDRWRRSTLYTIKPGIPYPMYWGIKFYMSKKKVAFWIHSRDMPGYPASHECVGVYDEEMQKKFHGFPKDPQLFDAKKLFLWLFPDGENDTKPYDYPDGLPDALIEIK